MLTPEEQINWNNYYIHFSTISSLLINLLNQLNDISEAEIFFSDIFPNIYINMKVYKEHSLSNKYLK